MLLIEDDFDHQYIFTKELSSLKDYELDLTIANSIEEASYNIKPVYR